ncbi:Ferredoxin-NADP reductase [Ekhidna lutea]|uniref:Ferredoxin-NADP reductase n=2 Tax=Ekhidna lutea TaxID=447679 RepID=A0A239KH41_EKHLU|nr:Ferredoxin-NADP reductase [Ekhidna lutea]
MRQSYRAGNEKNLVMETVKILSIENATHDVVHLKTEKPADIEYAPGQAVDVALNSAGMENELRAFTITSLPTEPFLEFYIKIYSEHDGVTKQIAKLKKNDTLLIGDVFGDIQYKGVGVFIAGGAGITPFIAIFKDLVSQNKVGNNKLIFANKTSQDIIEGDYFHQHLGKNFINVLSMERKDGFMNGHVSESLIKSQMTSKGLYYYLCGPPPMMDEVLNHLEVLGIKKSKIIIEQF